MAMQVSVDERVCQGHTLCALAVPEVFRLRDEDGHAYVESALVDPVLEAAVRDAEASCPEQAILAGEWSAE
jgi:ferredoxin